VNILRKYIIVEIREDKDIIKKIKISEEECVKLKFRKIKMIKNC